MVGARDGRAGGGGRGAKIAKTGGGESLLLRRRKKEKKFVWSKAFYTTKGNLARCIACGCHFSLSGGGV